MTSVGVGSTVGRSIVGSVPGAGLLRDSQKPLALLALWLAIAAPLGLRALLTRIPTSGGRRILIAAVAVGPLLLLPDLGWGVGGRLSFRFVFLFCHCMSSCQFSCRCLFFRLACNGYVYETFGISKHFPVKLQVLLIRAEMLDNPLTAKCFIYDVVCCPSFILFCLSVI